MATSNSNEEPPEISSSLLMKSLNFHGQELLRALQVEQGDKMMKYVDTKCLNYVEYHKRAPQAEFSLRSKRLRLLQFIAKKSDMLFKPANAEGNSTEQNEDMYAVMPPIEKFMVVPSNERRMRFFDELQRGDILIGTVRSRNHPGLAVPNSRGHCVLHLMCFDGKKKRYIEDLLIKAEVNHGEYNFNDLIRGYVYSHSPSTSKIVIGTDFPPDTALNKSLTNSMGNKHLRLGRIESDDVPRYMKYKDEPVVETLLEKIPSFHNPAAVENLCTVFGLQIANGCTSLMKKLVNYEVPKEEYATGLKKKQMSLWAMRCRQEGHQYSKEEKLTDAFQCLNNALRIDPENSEALIDRGCLFVSMEKFENAIDDFKTALTFDPESQSAKKYLSDAYMMLGEKFAALSDIDHSYENFSRAVEYNPSNHEAVSYLTAIVSVKNISDAEKAAQQNSDAEEGGDALAVKSPVKGPEPQEIASTTSDVWPTASAAAWQNSDTSWLSSYGNTSWPGTDSLVYASPSSHWQTAASAWSSAWAGASSAIWPMTSSTWAPVMSGVFPVTSTTGAISGIMHEECRSLHTPEQELSLDKSQNAMDMVPLDQLKHMIEEERDRHVLKRSRSRSVSSSSTSTSSRKRRRSSRRKKRRHKDDGSGGDDSGHSSESSLVDDHKQKCEEFVERNRRQIEKKKAQSRDTKGTSSKKDHKDKDKEESSNRKDYHRKSDVVHKKDCVKKTNRTSVKDHDKNSHKDSVSVTKEQKVNDTSVVKKDSKKAEEKSRVELSHVIDVDSEAEEPGEIIDDRDEDSEKKGVVLQSKEIEEITVKNEQKKKATVLKKKDESSSSENNIKFERSTTSSNPNVLLYFKCAIQNDVEQTVVDSGNVSSAVRADRSSTAGKGDQKTPGILVSGDDCPSIPHSKRGPDKLPVTEKPSKTVASQEANGLVLPKNKTVCDVPALPGTSSTPDLESLLSDVSSDSSTTVNTRDSDPQSKGKLHERKRRHYSSEKKRSHHRHHRRHKRAADSSQDDESYDIPDTPLSVARAADDRIVQRIRKEFHHTDKLVTSKQVVKFYFEALKDVTSQQLKYTVDRSLRRISELL